MIVSEEIEVTKRELVLEEVSRLLKTFNQYAILKEFGGLMDIKTSNSDLDILMSKSEMVIFLESLSLPEGTIKNLSKKSYMTTLELYFKDHTFLSIDFIQEFKQRHNYYLNSNILLAHAVTRKDGLKYASAEHNVEYILLFYILNGAKIPSKYIESFDQFDEETKRKVSFCLNNKFGFSLEELLTGKSQVQSGIRRIVKNFCYSYPRNKSIFRYSSYLRDRLKELFLDKKEPLISFSGVDGAGKTTVLYEVKRILENRYRKRVVVIRHRPSLLPILSAYVHGKEKASEISMSRLPRKGNNKNTISSLVRFLYYLTDYIIGQIWVSFKYSRRGIIVLYDRYYYDFILDGIRSNIRLNPWVPKLFFNIVKKPELNFFLYAPPEVILKRKQELSEEDIVNLTEKYTHLFKRFDEKYKVNFTCIENIKLNETLTVIINRFIYRKRSKNYYRKS